MEKDFILKLSKENPNAVLVGSLGNICKYLDEIDHKEKILVRGAMGCAMAVGLGYALGSEKQVIVIIGDGALLMKMGTMATLLRHPLKNLRVEIIDNGTYNSCGGQQTNYKYIKDLFSHDRIGDYPWTHPVPSPFSW